MEKLILEFKKPRTPRVQMYEKTREEIGTIYMVQWKLLGQWSKTIVTYDKDKAIEHFYYLVTLVTNNNKFIKYE